LSSLNAFSAEMDFHVLISLLKGVISYQNFINKKFLLDFIRIEKEKGKKDFGWPL